MHTLVTFATQWGSRYGGINSFNADFLAAFGSAYYSQVQIICIVTSATSEAIEDASKIHVRLLPLPYPPEATSFGSEHGRAGLEELSRLNIAYDPETTVWLGHDRITGGAAITAGSVGGGRSAVIHHMSYDRYESYAEDSQTAYEKVRLQTELFQKADIVLAVGPLLRDAASDLLGGAKQVYMLIPGLAEIDSRDAAHTFVAFLSGRLTQDAARIKQGHLGIAAFAKAHRDAREEGRPDALRKQPKLLLRGVDFEGQIVTSLLSNQQNPEVELKQFAAKYADGVINLHALPYTEDRQTLYTELSRSSAALMPSWHEGFGLVAWEAIAAGVPLIISQNSGVYQLLEEEYPGAGTGAVYSLDIRGSMSEPYFHPEDLEATAEALKKIADSPSKARKRASILKNMLEQYTWVACAEQTASALEWALKKGSTPTITPERISQTPVPNIPAYVVTDNKEQLLIIPTSKWRVGAGMADSQLLRAEEELLPFDPARQPDIDSLNAWLDDTQWPEAIRLITGAGGQGKTRLALELCRQRMNLGWCAGFLSSDIEETQMGARWQALRSLGQPLLIVLDYAETRQSVFLSLLKASLQNPTDKPVRMLLLARDAGEWWDNLPSKDPLCEALLSGRATSGPFPLPALYDAMHDRRGAFSKALRAFSEVLGVDAPDIVHDLLGEHFERPLYIQMAALLALHGERPTTAQGLTKALLNHERRYWSGVLAPFDWPEPERRAEQLLALTTFAGGFAIPRDAQPYWEKAKGTILSSADFNSLFRALVPLYPGSQGLQALRPDLLGEALVAQALLRPGGDTILDSVLASNAATPIRRNALTVLARLSTQRPDLQEIMVEAFVRNFSYCCQDIAVVAIETTSRLSILAELAFTRLSSVSKSQAAGLLEPVLMEESVQLAGLKCVVSEYLVGKFQEKYEKRPGNLDRMAEYARVLNSYMIALAQTGRYEMAKDAGLRALKLYRRLLVKNSNRFEPNYAVLLRNVAANLSETGRYEEALEHSGRALKISERLAREKPDRFEPDYANSLLNHSLRLSDIGEYGQALEWAPQARQIFARFMEKNRRGNAQHLFISICVNDFLLWLQAQYREGDQPTLLNLLALTLSPARIK